MVHVTEVEVAERMLPQLNVPTRISFTVPSVEYLPKRVRSVVAPVAPVLVLSVSMLISTQLIPKLSYTPSVPQTD
jgi:hypothetical protein